MKGKKKRGHDIKELLITQCWISLKKKKRGGIIPHRKEEKRKGKG